MCLDRRGHASDEGGVPALRRHDEVFASPLLAAVVLAFIDGGRTDGWQCPSRQEGQPADEWSTSLSLLAKKTGRSLSAMALLPVSQVP